MPEPTREDERCEGSDLPEMTVADALERNLRRGGPPAWERATSESGGSR